MTRGILKLDVLANLEYFSCFTMFSYNPEISKEYFVWVAIGSLFLISILIQAFGGYGTVSTSQISRQLYYHSHMASSSPSPFTISIQTFPLVFSSFELNFRLINLTPILLLTDNHFKKLALPGVFHA